MQNEILKFIVISIKKISNKKLVIDSKLNKLEYLHYGILDSLQIIHFIILIEKKYKIKFTSKDKESSDFRTIGGLVKLIKMKKNN